MKLTAKKRATLKDAVFGLPKERKYPMPDRQHAGLAKAYARRFATRDQQKAIFAKANHLLYGR